MRSFVLSEFLKTPAYKEAIVISDAELALITSEIGPQLKRGPKRISLSMHGKPIVIEYQLLQRSDADPELRPVVPVTGFGSGWRGITELGFYLAAKG